MNIFEYISTGLMLGGAIGTAVGTLAGGNGKEIKSAAIGTLVGGVLGTAAGVIEVKEKKDETVDR